MHKQQRRRNPGSAQANGGKKIFQWAEEKRKSCSIGICCRRKINDSKSARWTHNSLVRSRKVSQFKERSRFHVKKKLQDLRLRSLQNQWVLWFSYDNIDNPYCSRPFKYFTPETLEYNCFLKFRTRLLANVNERKMLNYIQFLSIWLNVQNGADRATHQHD